jgi:hypothetical protein
LLYGGGEFGGLGAIGRDRTLPNGRIVLDKTSWRVMPDAYFGLDFGRLI